MSSFREDSSSLTSVKSETDYVALILQDKAACLEDDEVNLLRTLVKQYEH